MQSASETRAGSPVERLPRHLKELAVDQHYERYTPVDHAVWRYIMRQSVRILRDRAHPAYLHGLAAAGIAVEAIPRIEEMNEILGRIGWGAVAVDGFIPPAAFMEFQAHRVLVIASDMRQLDHIEYTPAPDIVHEAAGHAPIIVDPEYAEYLRRFGEVGARAIASRRDFELYEAIRKLSALKEDPRTPAEVVARAEQEVADRQANLGPPSEAARISRLHWWTVEYGLIGTLEAPRIYGAGLISSIGEAVSCLEPPVRRLPYSLEAAEFAYDITTRQPQLFVTPGFAHLSDVLEQFASTMAFRIGGMEGLRRAMASERPATAVFSSGLQLSGVLAEARGDGDQPWYVRTAGPSALAWRDRQLPGHGRSTHPDGFGAPVGRLDDGTALEELSDAALAAHGLVPGRTASLRFASGVAVTGVFEHVERRDGRALVLRFSQCEVRRGDELLFRPEWGPFDLAAGARIISVFGGAADRDAFEDPAPPRAVRAAASADASDRELRMLYAEVRRIRESRGDPAPLEAAWAAVRSRHPRDWLLPTEILEVLRDRRALPGVAAEIASALEARAAAEPAVRKLIRQGLELAGAPAA